MDAPEQPAWRFPPTNGGQEYASSAAAQAFTGDEAVAKAVRELLQNSLDNPLDKTKPVIVSFRTFIAGAGTIGATQISQHINASYEQAIEDNDQKRAKQYGEMHSAISALMLDVLAVTDTNTTGLSDEGWRNLIRVEGSATTEQGPARGGSYGFGKNAPFNLSAIRTVFYTTRRPGQDGQTTHRSIGKAQLATHKNPDGTGTILQNVGFYAVHHGQDHQPIENEVIPEPLRLNENGTAIFIVAPPTRISQNWGRRTIAAAAQHFFHAIHNRHLIVKVQDQHGRQDTTIDHDTLTEVMDEFLPQDQTHHYLNAITTRPQQVSHADSPDNQLKTVHYHVLIAPGAPGKLAHINSRGMLITDARQHNPLYPRTANIKDWCVVAIPSHKDGSDEYARQFEPPTHDRIELTLPSNGNSTRARRNYREHEDNIRAALLEEAGISPNQLSDNVTELSSILPDQETTKAQSETGPEETNPGTEPDQNAEQVTEPHTPPPPPTDREPSEQDPEPTEPQTTDRSTTNPDIDGRAYLQDNETVALVFTMPHANMEPITISLHTAGEQATHNETQIPLLDAKELMTDDVTHLATNNGYANVSAPPGKRVVILARIPPQDFLYHGYTIVAK